MTQKEFQEFTCDSCGHRQLERIGMVETKEYICAKSASICFVFDQCMECWATEAPLSQKGRLKRRQAVKIARDVSSDARGVGILPHEQS